MKTLEEVFKTWEAVIGLEVHTELTTLNTKMFCGCKLEFGAAPNSHVCPVCLGLPGALPVPNKAAIESIVLAGLATNCDIEKHTMFYRKNYTYPDISSNFQITQGPVAFCMRGWMDIEVEGIAAKERVDIPEAIEKGSYTTRIGITRIHMEEDAGKLNHVGSTDGRIAGSTYSLVDYNRCSTPLIELVTEPDFRTPEEARLFMQKLRQIYLTLGISDCSMEEGSLRCDGNISLRRRGTTKFGTRAELKNMNSFKNLHDGLLYEICRQAEVLEEGGIIYQETRHWDPVAQRTMRMRLKETADDYRYFPEPNLTPFVLSDEFIMGIKSRLPELPDAKKRRFIEDFGLPVADAVNLANDVALSGFFDAAVAAVGAEGTTSAGAASAGTTSTSASLAKPISNLLLNDVTAYLNAEDISLTDSFLTPAGIAQLALLVAEDTISSKQAKEVFALMIQTGNAPSRIVEERGMKQVSDAATIEGIVEAVLAANPGKVAEYRDGKTGLLGFFVGQVMKETGGSGNPKLINETLLKRL